MTPFSGRLKRDPDTGTTLGQPIPDAAESVECIVEMHSECKGTWWEFVGSDGTRIGVCACTCHAGVVP